MKPVLVQIFEEPFSPRFEDSKWHVTQAITLLKLAEEKRLSRSLMVYAALEMRLAIEQEMFRIIRLVRSGVDERQLLARCVKKDGLFKELQNAEPNYTKLCYFMAVLADEIPVFPKVANWDIKQLRKHWHALSCLCHTPQMLGTQLSNEWYQSTGKTVFAAFEYMNSVIGSATGTGVLKLDKANAEYRKLCEDYLSGKIARAELRPALQKLLRAS